jgi:hypothetical protein
MPNFPQPQRQDESEVTDADLAALLAGATDAAPQLRQVADVLAALTAEPTGMELAGEAGALAEFRRQAAAPAPAERARHGTAGRSSRLGVKVGASVTAVAVMLGGGAAAAFANVLPAPIQRFAHEAIGAPVPQPRHESPHGGRSAAPGQPAMRGGPGAERQVRPHATPAPTAHGDSYAPAKQGNPQGKDPQGQQGQGTGQGHQGSGQGNGHGQGAGPGQQGNAHNKGPYGSPQTNQRPAGHPRRSVQARPAMDP